MFFTHIVLRHEHTSLPPRSLLLRPESSVDFESVLYQTQQIKILGGNSERRFLPTEPQSQGTGCPGGAPLGSTEAVLNGGGFEWGGVL